MAALLLRIFTSLVANKLTKWIFTPNAYEKKMLRQRVDIEDEVALRRAQIRLERSQERRMK